MITHFVPSQRLVAYVTVSCSVEGAQFCIGKLLQLLRGANVLVEQLLCFLLQFTYKHLHGILSPVGDKGPGEVRYYTTHHLICKAAWEVLLEKSRRCYRFIATTSCNTLCSIQCFIDPLQYRFKVSIYYKRCCQLFLDIGETTAWVLGKFGPVSTTTVESMNVQQLLARVGM